MKENLQPNRITHNKRPGSFGAFLLAIHNTATEASVRAEIKRAEGAGLARSAIDSVLQRLSTKKLWQRTAEVVAITEKGLLYLQEHGLIAV